MNSKGRKSKSPIKKRRHRTQKMNMTRDEDDDPSLLFRDWDVIKFEEAFKGWAFLSNEIRRKDEKSKLWKLIKKVNEVKEKYNAIINASKENTKTLKKGSLKKSKIENEMFLHGSTLT